MQVNSVQVPLYTNIWLIPTSLTSSEKMNFFGWFVVVVRHGQLDKHWSLHPNSASSRESKITTLNTCCEGKIDRQVKSNQKCKHHTTPHHTTPHHINVAAFFLLFSQFFLLLPSASTGSKGKRCKKIQHCLGTYHCQLKFFAALCRGRWEGTENGPNPTSWQCPEQYSRGERNSCSKTPILLRRMEQLF